MIYPTDMAPASISVYRALAIGALASAASAPTEFASRISKGVVISPSTSNSLHLATTT